MFKKSNKHLILLIYFYSSKRIKSNNLQRKILKNKYNKKRFILNKKAIIVKYKIKLLQKLMTSLTNTLA